jgi:SAM-dependent methyltransferase
MAREAIAGVTGAAASIPSPWAQAYPRAVRLAPDGLLVPSGALRALLGTSGRLEVLFTGFTLEPWIRHLDRVELDARLVPGPGDLALCDAAGWGDIRRILRRAPDGTCVTALDPYPAGRESLPAASVIATVVNRPGAGGSLGRAAAEVFPLWSRWAALRYWCRKILEAPDFRDDALESVKRKYASQVRGYVELVDLPLDEDLRRLLRGITPQGGSILVAGMGAGGEALHLARDGYRVTAFDYLPEMVRAARENARVAGVDVEFLCADMAELDLGGRRFDAVYITPLVYSFVPGRSRRVRSLSVLGRHLVTGGAIVFSAYLFPDWAKTLQVSLAWVRHAVRRRAREFGDWFTWYLVPDGSLGKSFSHLFAATSVMREVREAGFRDCRPSGAFFVATGFRQAPPLPDRTGARDVLEPRHRRRVPARHRGRRG